MYTQFFHLSAPPFSIAPDPRFMFESHAHQEGLAHLLYGIQVGGGFVALTGEVGTGKTLLCHCLLQQLPASVDMALILNPRLDAVELLASICDELGIHTAPPPLSLKCLVDALNKHLLSAHAQGRRTVLMIDEAQNLSLDVLEQIRLLTNLETTTDKLLQIILVGQPELQAILNRPALRQLNQRITARTHLQGLNSHETQAYIQHRLSVCQGDLKLFHPAALRRLFTLSGGIPRLINCLCDRALLGAYALGRQQIDVKIVNNAAKEMGLLTPTSSQTPPPRWQSRLLLLSASALLGSVVITQQSGLFERNNNPSPIAAPSQAPQQPATTFADLATQTPVQLTDALKNALKPFSKNTDPQTALDCTTIERLGLSCFLDRASWKEMLALQRPVILELERAPGQKIFALLTELSGNNAIFEMEKKISIPLEELMLHWNGYYLVLWEPPVPGIKKIIPNQINAAVAWLRQQLGEAAGPPEKMAIFDNALMQKVIAFQKQQQLSADGLVGVRTFIYLQNQQQPGRYPKLTRSN